jgi:hypothetical protein
MRIVPEFVRSNTNKAFEVRHLVITVRAGAEGALQGGEAGL